MDEVYGAILKNTSAQRLHFKRQTSGDRVELAEKPGVCFELAGEAREQWLHGVVPLVDGERISVTWRWFRDNGDGRAAAPGARARQAP